MDTKNYFRVDVSLNRNIYLYISKAKKTATSQDEFFLDELAPKDERDLSEENGDADGKDDQDERDETDTINEMVIEENEHNSKLLVTYLQL